MRRANRISTELAGKVAIVTGGANGLGRGTVELYLKEGAKVNGTYLRQLVPNTRSLLLACSSVTRHEPFHGGSTSASLLTTVTEEQASSSSLTPVLSLSQCH